MEINFNNRLVCIIASYIALLVDYGIPVNKIPECFFNQHTGELCDDLCEEDPAEVKDCINYVITNNLY